MSRRYGTGGPELGFLEGVLFIGGILLIATILGLILDGAPR